MAEYLTAKPDKKGIEGQLNLFGEEEQKVFCKVSSSRNLVRPEPKRKKYAHWTMARFFKDGIKPDKGYYVMPNTVKVGVNKCTGYSYLYYMQRTISDGKSPGNRIKRPAHPNAGIAKPINEVLNQALSRLNTKDIEIDIYTDSSYLTSALDLDWIHKWQQSGWKNSKGEPVKHADKWQKTLILLNGTRFYIYTNQHHEYSNWLKDQCDKKGPEENGK